MATSAPSSPRKRVSSVDSDIDEQPLGVQPLSRVNRSPSRHGYSEIPRTYSGLYGAGAPPQPDNKNGNVENDGEKNDDSILSPPHLNSSIFPSHGHKYQAESNLLPFELSRNRNTDWIAAGGPALLVTYISVILIFLLTFLAFVTEPKVAWAMTNVCHGILCIVYLHWIKGNPAGFMDGTQGEMNGMTCWEQIVCKPANHLLDTPSSQKTTGQTKMESPVRSLRESLAIAIKKLRSRDVLCVVPTLLAHASCHVAKYQFEYAVINVATWAVVMLPKMPLMNGVRILGINRTAGIDDGYLEEEECFDTEEDSSKGSDAGLEFNDGEHGHVDEGKVELKKDR